MSDELSRFMTEGFARYPEAFAAVTRFEQEIKQALTEVMLGSETWGAFTRSAKPPSTNSGGRPGKGCWIYAIQQGTLRSNDIGLEMGLWWEPPLDPRGSNLIAYANPTWAQKKLEKIRNARPDDPVRVQTLDGKARFVVDLSPEGGVSSRLEQLFGEMTTFLSGASEAE